MQNKTSLAAALALGQGVEIVKHSETSFDCYFPGEIQRAPESPSTMSAIEQEIAASPALGLLVDAMAKLEGVTKGDLVRSLILKNDALIK